MIGLSLCLGLGYASPTMNASGNLSMPGVSVVNVKDPPYNAKGDQIANDTVAIQAAIDACFGNRVNPIAPTQFRQLYFPAGHYKISTPGLVMESISGGRIFGDGRFASVIRSAQIGGTVLRTNGFEYCSVSDLQFIAATDGTCFDLDWDGLNTPRHAALQSNLFQNIYFDGGDYGIRIGRSVHMGSENTIIGCFFSGHDVAGAITENSNALQNVIIGGNIAGCGIGVYAWKGSFSNVIGTGFQVNTTCDIQTDSSANDTITISGCRSESVNFAHISNQQPHITGCVQSNAADGLFLELFRNRFVVDSCVSFNGKVRAKIDAHGTVRGSQFGRDDWLLADQGLRVNVDSVRYGKTMVGTGSGAIGLEYPHGYIIDGVYTPY